MIETVSDFLEQFREYALDKIEKDDPEIKHRPTIGNIFEGLTSRLLNKSIFKGLNIKIVENSFIVNNRDEISPEMDCMLVIGDGIQISFTDQYKYHIKDVVAVIQVKKKLYANDLDDSYQNLKAVIDINEPRKAEPYVNRTIHDGFKALTSKRLPEKENLDSLSERESILYHFLMMEAYHPLRIVIGYYGYQDEYGLREGFVNKLEEICKDGPVRGYSPGSFPNLIICGKNTINKNNAMPIGIPFQNKDYYWPVLLTSNEKPMYYLLELIWTRLSYKFEISSEIFGDDFDFDTVHPFISCKEKKIDNENFGWEYNFHELSRKTLSEPLAKTPWKPAELNKAQYSILFALSEKKVIDIYNDQLFLDFLINENEELDIFIDKLVETKLVYVNEGKMYLLVDDLLTTFSPEGTVYAGENKNGEMTNYIMKNIK